MNKTLCILSVLLLTGISTFAQKEPLKFGDVTLEEVRMKKYLRDTSAAAVVLGDFGSSVIRYEQKDGFQIHFERTLRMKILKKQGLDYAKLQIGTWRDDSRRREEKLTNLKVSTYNLVNGKIEVTKADESSFFKENRTENLTYTKIAWKNVKVGSVLEVTYRIKSDFLFNFIDWQFQYDIPVRWSEYRAQIPEYFGYEKYMQGYVGLAVNERTTRTNAITYIANNQSTFLNNQSSISQRQIEYEEENFRWAAMDIPAFQREPYMANADDYMAKLNFEFAYTKYPDEGMRMVLGSWEDINRTYWERIGNDVNIGAGTKDAVGRIIADASSDQDKAARIFRFVQENIVWDSTYRTLPESNPGKTLSNKRGSSAAVNVLLASMLNKANLTANPVLVSTRDHGFVRETIPVASQFNTMICAVKIGDKLVLLDATSALLPFGTISTDCLNGRGLMLGKEGFQWVSLEASAKSRTIYNADLELAADGSARGVLKVERGGYDSWDARRKIRALGQNRYQKEFESANRWSVSKSELSGLDDITLPVKEIYTLSADVAEGNGDMLYVNPFLGARIAENPFKSEQRLYPVDFTHSFELSYMARIVVPDGYTIEELPESKMLGLPANAGRYVYNLTQSGNVINFMSGLTINRSMFTQEEYANLRAFYAQVVAKQAEQIVLKRK